MMGAGVVSCVRGFMDWAQRVARRGCRMYEFVSSFVPIASIVSDNFEINVEMSSFVDMTVGVNGKRQDFR
jgi:hypothetical protein